MNDINLFRLNCLLSDHKLNNFNSVIISLAKEYLFERGNVYLSRSDCYKHITVTLDIKLEEDIFHSLLEKSKQFNIKSKPEEVVFRLKNSYFDEIKSKIENHSIEKHIEVFLKKKQLSFKLKEKFNDLLSESIYNNINTFSVKAIKSIIDKNKLKQFSAEETETFNSFLEWKDEGKNAALYNLFLKAIEFAIVTSGRGVKEFTKSIFEGKSYLLDANIIFRLIGIGGKERKDSLRKLISSCIKQGIKFKYSVSTFNEVINKIENSVRDIAHYEKGKVKNLQELVADSPYTMTDGFLVHYCECLNSGEVKSIEKYELLLRTEFKKLDQEFSLERVDCSTNLDGMQLNSFQKFLKKRKAEINPQVRYTDRAANVDAINILYIRKMRGNNNYNYSDVKYFYLSTDRILNQILVEDKNKMSESILPSQLFILHSAFYEDSKTVDYETFIKFLKKHTTEYKLTGEEVLNYIDQIREITTEEENIKNIIITYSDMRYKSSLKSYSKAPLFKSIKEFAHTYLDEALIRAEKGEKNYNEIYGNAIKKLQDYFIKSRTTTRIIDGIITIIILPVISFTVGVLTSNYLISILCLVAFEGLKVYGDKKSESMLKLWRYFYNKKVNDSELLSLMDSGKEYELQASEYFDINAKSIWEKF